MSDTRRSSERLAEDDWQTPAMRDSGVLNRILHAAPGDEIPLRKGTTELTVSAELDLTWSDILQTLSESDVIEDVDLSSIESGQSLTITKNTEALGEAFKPEETVSGIASAHAKAEMRALNFVESSTGLYNVIKMKLLYAARNSELNEGQQGCVDALHDGVLMSQIFKILDGNLPIGDENYTTLYGTVKGTVASFWQKKTLGTEVISRMSEAWASSVVGGIAYHDLNKEANHK